MKNANLAASVLDEEEARNPPGKWQRKRVIDWTQWSRRWGTTVSATNRDEEKEYTLDSFVKKCIRGGETREEAISKWKDMVSNPSIEREGSGANLVLWIPQARKRLRDKTLYVDNAVTEGSKQHRGLPSQDVADLKEFCHSSMKAHTDDFFKGAFAGLGDSEEALQSVNRLDPPPFSFT